MIKPIADISAWQLPENLNYDALVEGTSGIILRACYGIHEDIKFNRHYDEITKRGGMVGAYHFLLSGQDISSQAAAIERILQGKKLPLGVWADVEITSWSKLSRNQLESYLIRTREHFGESLGIYTSQYMWDSSIGAPMIGSYKLWVANYKVEKPNLPRKGLWQDWWLWQFTNKGRIDGVAANLDLSLFNGTQEQFEGWVGSEIPSEKVWPLDRITRAIVKLCEIHKLDM